MGTVKTQAMVFMRCNTYDNMGQLVTGTFIKTTDNGELLTPVFDSLYDLIAFARGKDGARLKFYDIIYGDGCKFN
jgi:hypothetical protein